MKKLEGQIAVVSGGGNGIGEAVARDFARHGASVAIIDIDAAAARRTAQAIEDAGGKALAIVADASQDADVAAAFERIIDDLGEIDVLANIAGKEHYKSFTDFEPHEWDRSIAINLRSVYLCCRPAIISMMRNGGGSIVNTSSVQALATGGSISAYAAAKAGVIALTKDLARDYGPHNIRVNAICPGCIDTPMMARALNTMANADEVVGGLCKSIPLNRIGTPFDVAQVVTFLASSEAAYVSGTAITIDGGWLAKLPLPEA